MQKEHRDAIIYGIFAGVAGTIILYLIQGKVSWAYLFTCPIFTFIFHLYLKRRARAFDWVFKIATWVQLMITVIIARFATAWAGGKKG